MNILVVDDEPALRQLIRRYLDRDFDVTIIEADDGLTALDVLLKEPVELVLLDINMKVMGGIETLEAIRQSQSFSRLPVVLMTAHADEDLFRRAVELGVDGCLVKPFTPTTLRERLATIIGNRRSSDHPGLQTTRFFEIAPGSRALIVDQSPEFRTIASRLIGRLCVVEEAENEFMAIKRCLGGTFDLLFVGETSELSTTAGLARKVRATADLRKVRIAAAVPPEEREAAKALGVFDAVLSRSFIEDTFDASLCEALGQDTLARLLFHPTSTCVTNLFDLVLHGLTRWLGQGITMHEMPQQPAGDSRWVLVSVEIQARRQAWDLRLRCPLAVAMEFASSRQPTEPGKVDEERAKAAAGHLVEEFAEEFRPILLARGLSCRWFPARVTVVGAAGLASAKMKSMGMRRWYATPVQQIIPVELVPLHRVDEPAEPAELASASWTSPPTTVR